MEKAMFLLLSKCQLWDAVQTSALLKLYWKCEEVLKCIEMKARLWFSGSILHAIDVTEQTFADAISVQRCLHASVTYSTISSQ